MYLVQVTITDLDTDLTVESPSQTCEDYRISYSPGGVVVDCGPQRQPAGTGGGVGADAIFAIGRKLLQAAAEKQQKSQATGDGGATPKSGGCCGE